MMAGSPTETPTALAEDLAPPVTAQRQRFHVPSGAKFTRFF